MKDHRFSNQRRTLALLALVTRRCCAERNLLIITHHRYSEQGPFVKLGLTVKPP